ncbi:MAG TPA: hypothetical protein PKC19_21860 [Roseiflexaceae bacterium]|nr:hypothetical protein [Roseiflexaceae bacterium]
MTMELFKLVNRAIDELDISAATATVERIRAAAPASQRDELIERLIREKMARTAGVGALTSGAGMIPGIGTLAALTIGAAADIGATFKLQAELVLEIAVAYQRDLSPEERRNLVLLVTGITAGTSQLAGRIGQKAALTIGERYATRSIAKAVPFLGVAASASLNALTTYVIGKRAEAYFRLDPQLIGDMGEVIRVLSGVDERAVRAWLAEQGQRTANQIRLHAGALADAGRANSQKLLDAGRTNSQKLLDAGRTNSQKLLDAGGERTTTARRTVGDLVQRAGNRLRRRNPPSDT